MEIVIRKLTPDLAEDYARFFDTTPHADNKEEHRCYCVFWCGEDCAGKDFSTPEKRRAYAVRSIQTGCLQGYLAYRGGAVVGWCNANAKADCLKSYCWRRFMGGVPATDCAGDVPVKSVFCFAISPEHRRAGVASRLLERVCADAAADGFAVVEAYPNKTFADEELDYMGPLALFEAHGFAPCCETGDKLVMRKALR